MVGTIGLFPTGCPKSAPDPPNDGTKAVRVTHATSECHGSIAHGTRDICGVTGRPSTISSDAGPTGPVVARYRSRRYCDTIASRKDIDRRGHDAGTSRTRRVLKTSLGL